MKLDKILKKLPKTVKDEMDEMLGNDLRRCVADSEENIATAVRERDDNTQYQAAKQSVKDLSEGLREVKSYQTAKIQYALHLLRELNGVETQE